MSGIEIQAVSKTYGRTVALNEVSLTVTAGTHTAILGTSGCGKSTLLRLLAGLDAPSSGKVRIDGVLVSDTAVVIVPPHKRGIGMVFQDLALWPNLSARENVLVGLSGSGLNKTERSDCAEAVLLMCGITKLRSRLPGDLSGGEQQRVALARALGPHPRYLLLDEPFSSLDWITRERLFRDISSLASEQSITMLLVTHDPTEATTLCPRAAILDRGVLIEEGSFSDLLEHPMSEIMKVFKTHLL